LDRHEIDVLYLFTQTQLAEAEAPFIQFVKNRILQNIV